MATEERKDNKKPFKGVSFYIFAFMLLNSTIIG
jgi:hypothetical protein